MFRGITPGPPSRTHTHTHIMQILLLTIELIK